jgi:hypothetical protein
MRPFRRYDLSPLAAVHRPPAKESLFASTAALADCYLGVFDQGLSVDRLGQKADGSGLAPECNIRGTR